MVAVLCYLGYGLVTLKTNKSKTYLIAKVNKTTYFTSKSKNAINKYVAAEDKQNTLNAGMAFHTTSKKWLFGLVIHLHSFNFTINFSSYV